MGGRILLVDNVPTNRIAIAAMLRRARYVISMASDGAEARDLMAAAAPDLILVAARLPDMTGLAFLSALKSDANARRVPVVLLSETRNRKEVIEALDAGAEDILKCPVDELTLMARARSLLRARETDRALDQRQVTVRELGFAESTPDFSGPARVVLVAEDRSRGVKLGHALKEKLRHPVTTLDTEGALAEADGAAADVFVIEATMETPGDGLRLMAELRSRPGSRHSAIVIIAPEDDAAVVANALDLGANDLLLLGFDPEELALRLKTQLARKRRADLLRASVEDGLRLAVIDPLTGLYNRRYAHTHIDQIDQIARKTGRQYAIMLADIDRFKAINDTFGHAAGDAVLVEVAKRLRDNLRGIDMIARIGGEEFLIALPKTDAKEALLAAKRLIAIIAHTPVLLPQADQKVPVTISIGLAMSNQPGGLSPPVNTLIDKADQALYAAKADGRNQVTVSRTAA